MASNSTPNYSLPQWEMDDRILVEDFNEAMHNIDEALSLKAQVIIGSYEGDGSAERTITLGKTPKAVLVMSARGEVTHYAATSKYICYGGLALAGSPVSVDGQSAITVVNNGFKVYRDNLHGPHIYTNEENLTYNYIAFY